MVGGVPNRARLNRRWSRKSLRAGAAHHPDRRTAGSDQEHDEARPTTAHGEDGENADCRDRQLRQGLPSLHDVVSACRAMTAKKSRASALR
jgi:hypothetical protein